MKLKTSAAVAALLAGALSAGAVSAQTYDRLVVFGDSLSDNGNAFRASGGTNPPSPPYFRGRFSNGPVFTELLGFNLSAFPTVTGSTNFAFGGAETTGPGRSGTPPLQTQVNLFLASGGRFGSRDLVSVYGGGNNLLNAFPQVGAAPNPVGAIQAIAGTAAADIGRITNQVAGAGAGTVVVFNLPGLGGIPLLNRTPAAPLADLGSQAFNGALAGQLTAVAAANANSNIILVDVFRFNEAIRAQPQNFGLSNLTDACLNSATGAVCASPDSFAFWDGVHPTAALNRIFANLALDYIYYGSRGAASAALGETGLEHRQSAQDAALARLEESGEQEGLRFALMLDGARGEEDERGDIPAIERDTASIRVAVDGALRPDLRLGVVFSGSESDVDAGALQFDGSSYGAEVYFGFTRESVFANLVLGGATDEYTDYARATGAGPVVHDADRVTGSSYGAKLQAGVRFPLGAGTLSPRAALSAIRTEVESFGENGPAARHAVSEHKIEAVAGEASLRYDTPFGSRLRGHVEAGYGAFLDYNGDVEVALVDNPARPLSTTVEEPGRGALLDVGVSGEVFGGAQLGLSYRGRFDDGSDSHAALLTIAIRR